MGGQCETDRCAERGPTVCRRRCFAYDTRPRNGRPTALIKSERQEARWICRACWERMRSGRPVLVLGREGPVALMSDPVPRPEPPRAPSVPPPRPRANLSPPKYNNMTAHKKHGKPTPPPGYKRDPRIRSGGLDFLYE